VNAYGHAEDMPQVDVVLVCLKTIRNKQLKDLLPPLLKADTLVVLIQNGIGVEEDVQRMFPEVQLVAGLAFICSSKIGPGHISHQCYGSINLGNYSCRDEQRIKQFRAELEAAGIRVGEMEYHQARWKKAVWNMPFNGMTVALETQTDCLLKHPSTLQLIREQMLEVITVAQRLGVTGLDETFADKMIETTDAMTPYSLSMRLDYDNRRPMEIDYLYSRPIAMAHEAGLSMPRLEMLESELRFIEAQRLNH
jgi:2-dehydropantoate 2-reductase